MTCCSTVLQSWDKTMLGVNDITIKQVRIILTLLLDSPLGDNVAEFSLCFRRDLLLLMSINSRSNSVSSGSLSL